MANLKVNAEVWNKVFKEDQARIATFVKSIGLLEEKDNILPEPSSLDPQVLSATHTALGIHDAIEKFMCEIGCDAMGTTLKAACLALTDPDPNGIEVCLTVAELSIQGCKEGCP
ncbi:hypothetical protein H6F93_01855 [Leptolyngbya sp. FACHB-671]|uniref:hypothetical protein n=1 Tax=Leptolyngbya sp. FACHB-671 TaxID=2692812 RepID=UPI0016831F97|nr:hypothetical protein [Leptolyngbya sp. FACHB-671]MBD2066283.1 hypothetical protein [Leptolyngbya sp. FACHB-671]